MKRSITYVAWTLGSASLIALAMGCSRESRQPQTPTGTTSPTFESNVPPGPSAAGREQPPMPGEESGAAGQASPSPPAPPPGSPGEMGAPPDGAPRGTEQPPASPAGENERQLCDALASGAKLHVEDVQNGAAIVAVPKAGHDIASVRGDAHRIESTAKQHGAAESAPAAGDACGLFAIARMPGVSTTLTEGPRSVRIVMTTSNPAEVRDVRRIAREQVSSLKAR
jgi:hypothetical protein